jgi:predicted anti-sigma-YlaC factor YlaD
MEVTRDVIRDLLPLYLAGEASADTQVLVKEYLEHDPDLAQLARQWKGRLPGPPPAPLRPDAQALAYLEARRQIAMKTVLLAVVITAGTIALITLVGFVFYSSP